MHVIHISGKRSILLAKLQNSDFWPKNGQIWPKICMLGSFGALLSVGYLVGGFGAQAVSRTYLLYDIPMHNRILSILTYFHVQYSHI